MTRKYSITLKAPPCLCVQKIQCSGGVSRQIQYSALPRAVLASRHTPLYCIFRTHAWRCFNSNVLYFAWEDQSDAMYRILHTVLINCITVLYESYSTVMQLIGQIQYSYVENLFVECYVNNTL